ncbi:MAG: hypothetical protein ABWZ76_07715 [Acidimicrobiales bacterium]
MSFVFRRFVIGLLIPFLWRRWRDRSSTGRSAAPVSANRPAAPYA